MKTPIPGRLPPPIPMPWSPAEKSRLIQMIGINYFNRFGDRSGGVGPYLNLVLPELIKRSSSPAQLEAWDKNVKELIDNYGALRLGRHSDYVFGILAPLIRKTKTLADLKAWDRVVKTLVSDYKIKRLELCWCYVLCILPELIDRSSNATELKVWDAAAKAVVASLTDDKEHNIRRVIPKMIKQATNPNQLEALAALFG
mgnify:CR=1 FL=1